MTGGQTELPVIASTPVGVSAEVLLMLLADARLPTGAHTQSAGLEAALRAGLPAADIPVYLGTRLRTVTATEAAAAVVARRTVLTAAGSGEWTARLVAVDDAWRARTIAPALRENAAMLGRGYLRLIVRLWPTEPAVAALQQVPKPTRALVIGVAAAIGGLTASQVGRLVGYDDVQTVAAAALKIEPFDPATAARWVLEAGPAIDAMAEAVAECVVPEDIPAAGALQIERWAELHAVATSRLFRA